MISPKKSIQDIKINLEEDYQNWRLKLNLNENIYGANPLALNVLKNFDNEDLNIYPSQDRFIERLSQKYSLSNNCFLMVNDVDVAIDDVIRTYIDSEDELISYVPTNSFIEKFLKISGGIFRPINYIEKFVFDKDYFAKNITEKTKIAYIATPNNPTGEIVRASVLKILIEEFQDVLFVLDCSYVNFAKNIVIEDYLDLVKEFDNVIILKSFSNDFGLAGLRVGFCVSSANIINELKKIKNIYSVPAPSLKCAAAVLADDKFIENVKEKNNEARELLIEILSENCYKPFESEANFVLCDFYNHCDFYYKKFKNNGIIVQKFDDDSDISTCLRITVPTVGGVKFIAELLKVKPLLIFDIDGTIFDVSESYILAIKETFKHFARKDISLKEIYDIKNQGGMNCNWVAIKHLLSKNGFDVDLIEIITVFQELLYNPQNTLLDNEKILISKEKFEELNKKYDLAIFSGRLKEEALYSLKRFEIDKYFNYYITSDDLPKNMLKPHPKGVLKIIKHCPHKDIKLIGSSVDDIIAGNSANVTTIGVIDQNLDANLMLNKFKHVGAKYILNASIQIEEFLEKIENEKQAKEYIV